MAGWPEFPAALRSSAGLAGARQSWLGFVERARRAQKSRFRHMASGLGHGDVGTPYFFHTFQRRSNRGRATILDQSTDSDEISGKDKSLVSPISGPPTGAANGGNLQFETIVFRMEEIH